MTKTVLYARVSTAEQTIEHQTTQARSAGLSIDEVVADKGVSGVATCLRDRPQGRRLFDLLRRGDVLVVRWIDRLGRDYADVSDALREFMKKGVKVRTIIHGMVFDGTATDAMTMAVRDALIAFMAATAQAQAEATKEAQRAGIAHARASEDGRYMGRKPSFTRAQVETVDGMLQTSATVAEMVGATGLTRQTIGRIRADRSHAEAVLTSWGL